MSYRKLVALAWPTMLVLSMIVGCRPITVEPPPLSSDLQPSPTVLVRAVAVINDVDYVVFPQSKPPIKIPHQDGTLLLEFSGPIDLCSVPDGTYTAVDAQATKIRASLPRAATSFEVHHSLMDVHGKQVQANVSHPYRGSGYQIYRPEHTPAISMQATLDLRPEIEIPFWLPITVMWHEVINIKFTGDLAVERDFVMGEFADSLKPYPHSLEWVNDDTLHLTLGEYVGVATLDSPYSDLLRWTLVMVPQQRITVTDIVGAVLSTIDIPVGVLGALGMNADYTQARLTQAASYDPYCRGGIGVTEHLFELATSEFTQNFPTVYTNYFPKSGEALEVSRRIHQKVDSLGYTGPMAAYASPYADHLFAISYYSTEASYYLLDYAGNGPCINQPGEYITLIKWLDADRALVNKSSRNFSTGYVFPDSKCYVYHITENRFDYLGNGYGFDCDLETGRVFILQTKPTP